MKAMRSEAEVVLLVALLDGSSSYDYWGSRLHVHSCETVLRISGVTLGVLLRCSALRLVQGIQTSLEYCIQRVLKSKLRNYTKFTFARSDMLLLEHF